MNIRKLVALFVMFSVTLVVPRFSFGQLTVDQLLKRQVESVGPQYKDVEDAILVYKNGNAEGALRLLQSACEKRSELPPAEVMLTHILFAFGKVKDGRAVLEVAGAKYPDDPEAYSMLADLAMREGHFVASELLFRKGLEVSASYDKNMKRRNYVQINCHAGLASIDERRGNWSKAQKHLSDWIKIDASNLSAKMRMAKTMFRQKLYPEALQTLVQIRLSKTGQPHPEVTLGIWYEQIGDHDKAKKSIETGLQKASDDFATRTAAASWAISSGEIEIAKVNAIAAKRLQPKGSQTELILGQVARFEKDFNEAENRFRNVLEKSPANASARNYLALTLLAKDESAQHSQALEYAMVNFKSNSDLKQRSGREAASTLAWALFRLGRVNEAEKTITTVLNSGQVSPDTAYYAAKIYHRLGKVEVASRLLNGALKSTQAFPDREDAETFLKAISSSANTGK